MTHGGAPPVPAGGAAVSMLALHSRAIGLSRAAVAAVGDHQWDLPTPCADWTVRGLVAHMIRENRGFAAAAGGETVDRSEWSSPVGPDPRAEYRRSADLVCRAFAAPGVLERRFWLPGIDPGVLYPARQAVSFHLLDYLVHAWDVAAAVGHRMDVDADLVAAVAGVAAREVPDGERRRRRGASFRPALALPPDAAPLDRLLAYLGRDPRGW